jgi:hypothetical protein
MDSSSSTTEIRLLLTESPTDSMYYCVEKKSIGPW